MVANNLVVSFETLRLRLDIKTAHLCMRYTSPTTFSRAINGVDPLPISMPVHYICDLGFTFTPSLWSRARVDSVTRHAQNVQSSRSRQEDIRRIHTDLGPFSAHSSHLLRLGRSGSAHRSQTTRACPAQISKRYKTHFKLPSTSRQHSPVLRFLNISSL